MENIYQHFKKDELTFIDQMNERLINVEENYTPVLTDFLNPRQFWILESLIHRYDGLKYRAFGGRKNAESQRVVIVPDFMAIEIENFKLALLEIIYPTKFAELTHSQILGTVLSQGIERSKIGDILHEDNRFQIIVDEDIAKYLIAQIDRIASFKVRLNPIEFSKIIINNEEIIEKSLTISSLRLDNLISNVYNISRERSKQLIERGRVKLNFRLSNKIMEELDISDLVSVRGYGRFQLLAVNGRSKKDKIKILVGMIGQNRSEG